MIFTVFSISIDCPNVISLALGLNLHLKQPSIWTALRGDCCVVSNIGCTNQRVTGISFENLGLNGTINGTALPSQLYSLYLDNNKISGNIPTKLPNGLGDLILYTNKLSGPIPMELPSGLYTMYLLNNNLTGSIPSNLPNTLIRVHLTGCGLTGPIPNPLPSALQLLYLADNFLTGSLPVALPNPLQELHIYSNALSGNIPSTLPNGLKRILLYDNRFSGLLPTFPSILTDLQIGKVGYSGNQFSGALVLNKPSIVTINDNLITDIAIKDRSQLSSCDLSKNPLLGNPQILNLTMCTINELFSPAQMTTVFTPSESLTMSKSESLSNQQTENTPVYFEMPTTAFRFNFLIILRLFVSWVGMTYVLIKAPFLRELKTWRKKKETRATSSAF